MDYMLKPPEEPDPYPPDDDDGPLEPDDSANQYSDEAADAAEDKWLAARAAPYDR